MHASSSIYVNAPSVVMTGHPSVEWQFCSAYETPEESKTRCTSGLPHLPLMRRRACDCGLTLYNPESEALHITEGRFQAAGPQTRGLKDLQQIVPPRCCYYAAMTTWCYALLRGEDLLHGHILCAHTCMHAQICIYIYIYLFFYLCISMHACMYACTNVRMPSCKYCNAMQCNVL